MKIKCWECGKIATKRLDCFLDSQIEELITKIEKIPQAGDKIQPFWYRCYCDECAEKVRQQDEEEMREYIRLKKRMMFKKALRLLEKQNTDMYKYREAIDVVEEHIENNPDKYDSSYEVVAAIVLVHNRIYAKMQYKVGRYQVDFLLPEMLVALEIDGERHKNKKEYDTKRDIYIQNALGEGWDIVRIKTDYLDMKATKLPEAIEKVIQYRQEGKVNWRKLYN